MYVKNVRSYLCTRTCSTAEEEARDELEIDSHCVATVLPFTLNQVAARPVPSPPPPTPTFSSALFALCAASGVRACVRRVACVRVCGERCACV